MSLTLTAFIHTLCVLNLCHVESLNFLRGKYDDDKLYPLYIQRITCTHFKVKENMLPTIQIKKSIYKDNEYLEEAGGKDGEVIALTLTNIDLQLFLEHYKVDKLEYESGWKFKSTDTMFNEYIDKWIDRKNKATISKNKGQRTLAKLMLNSLYGKLATSLEAKSKKPYIGEDGAVHYELLDAEEKKGIYIPRTVAL